MKTSLTTSMRKIGRSALVTGGTGYIGSHLVGALLKSGWGVHVLLRPSSSPNLLKPFLSEIQLHEHDATMAGMACIMNEAKPDVVFHLAAMTSSDHRMEEVDSLLQSNVVFSTQLVEAMFRQGVRYLVNTETFWQWRSGKEQYEPMCLYAATKQAFHDILRYYVDAGSLNALSLVLYDTYGEDDPRRKLFTYLKQASQEDLQIEMTLGEQIIDLTYIEDVVSAFLRAADLLVEKRPNQLDVYSVTSGQRMRLRELIDLIQQECKISFRINWGGKPYRINEVMNPWLGQPLPGWQPKVSLASGLQRVFGVAG